MSEPVMQSMLCVGGSADGQYRRAPAKHGACFIELVLTPIEDVPLDGMIGAEVNARRCEYRVVEWAFGAYPSRYSYFLLVPQSMSENDVLRKLIEGYRRP